MNLGQAIDPDTLRLHLDSWLPARYVVKENPERAELERIKARDTNKAEMNRIRQVRFKRRRFSQTHCEAA